MSISALALDLASTTGWASVSSGVLTSGVRTFSTSKRAHPGLRFLMFGRWIREMIDQEKPDLIFYEEVVRQPYTAAAQLFGAWKAMLAATACQRETPVIGLNIKQIKKFATHNGNANKDMMLDSAKKRWPDADIFDHNEADALWVLEFGLQNHSPT